MKKSGKSIKNEKKMENQSQNGSKCQKCFYINYLIVAVENNTNKFAFVGWLYVEKIIKNRKT